MKQVLLIGAGSAIGGMLRYIISIYFNGKSESFPWATLSVNLIGSFCIGLVFAIATKAIVTNDFKLFLATGILGGFTTFSAFSYECMQLAKQGQWSLIALYIGVSVFGGIACAFGGYTLVK